ncbi:MAG: hypothetical protein AB1Z23_09665 [Eubacteriales bacterium]
MNTKERNLFFKKIGRFFKNCGSKVLIQIVLFAGLTYGGVKLAELLMDNSLFEPISILEMLFGESEIVTLIGSFIASLLGLGIVGNVIIMQGIVLLVISILFLAITYKGEIKVVAVKRTHINLMISVMLIALFLLTSGFGAFFGNGRAMILSWVIPLLVCVIGVIEILISVNRFTGVNYFLLKTNTKNVAQENKDE